MEKLSLIDAITFRMGELSRLLAGLATLAPAEIMPEVQTLEAEDLLDEHAKRFLLALGESELTRENAVKICFELGFWKDMFRWQGLVLLAGDGFEQIGTAAVDEIKKLVILVDELPQLSRYASQLEAGKK